MKPETCRRILRRWRASPLRAGHVALRRRFERSITAHQQLQLARDIYLPLDLKQHNQATLFWYPDHEEPALQWALRTLLPVGGRFVDCGANNGFMSLLAAAWRSASILALEPHPRLAEKLRTTFAANGLDEVATVVESAADTHESTAPFYESPTNDGAHSLESDWPEATHEIGKVHTRPLKTVVEEHGFLPIDFLKIDTEGHDLNVLQSLGDQLRPESVKCVYTEATWKTAEIIELMTARGYCGFIARTPRFHEMKRVRERETQGKPVDYFTALSSRTDVDNLLWCGKNTPQQRLIARNCSH